MSPRKKPKAIPLPDVVAANIKTLRERQEWTQEQLAEQMRMAGFDNWGRTTVTEVEGAGRRRQVSITELLGLASIFGVGFEAFLWPYGTPGDSLEVMPKTQAAPEGFVIEERLGLFGLLVSPESLAAVTVDLSGRLVELATTRLSTIYTERIRELAEELRNTAGWIEEKAAESLTPITTETVKGKSEQS
jgi:transcriptional regulator with XRE-family HTH domain